MTGGIVCDASAVVSALLDSGEVGTWAVGQLAGSDLFAPAHMPVECANVLRRHELAGLVSAEQAVQAHADLVDLPVDLWPYEVLAARVWELRLNLTSYDAAYVALAEVLEVPLVTVDDRIRRAPGITCLTKTPPATS